MARPATPCLGLSTFESLQHELRWALAWESHWRKFSQPQELGGVNGVSSVTEQLIFGASRVEGVLNKGPVATASIHVLGQSCPCSPNPEAQRG